MIVGAKEDFCKCLGRVGRLIRRDGSRVMMGPGSNFFFRQASVVNLDFDCACLSVYGELEKKMSLL